MKRVLFFIFSIFFCQSVCGQLDSIPQWFFEELEAHIGVWVTDNAQYKSETEPIDQFGMEWKMAIGGTSMTGRLYGLKDGQEIGTYWEFREYWNPIQKLAIIQQFGAGGIIGMGPVNNLGSGHFESFQTFMQVDGSSWKQKHVNILKGNTMDSTSYNHDDAGGWVKDRHYVWIKQQP